jgi:glycosyltransferase involved in cell wall biosynthesis
MIPVTLLGPLARQTGYAVGFRALVKELLKRGKFDIDLVALKGIVPLETEPYLLNLIHREKDCSGLGLLVGFPINVVDLKTRYRIIYSMYEADDIPEAWQGPVREADEVWVPTHFLGPVFGKYTRRLKLVPWGIDTEAFKRGEGQPNDVYTFGAVGVQSPRKGTDVLVKAFDNAFGESGKARLIIKTRDTRTMPEISNKYIEVVDEEWEEERLVRFYHEVDCVVQASRGEGVGMPPLQAAFCGTPSLVTKWSGPVDYIDDNGVWGIEITGLSKAKNIGANNANWAEPSVEHLTELMRWAAETRPEVRGDYDRFTARCMADHVTTYLTEAWGRCQR